MVRKIELTVPTSRRDYVLSVLRDERLTPGQAPIFYDVHYLAVYDGHNTTLITFRANEKKTGHIIDRLDQHGVGVDFGVVDISQLQMVKPLLSNHRREMMERQEEELSREQGGPVRRRKKKKRRYQVDDRLTVEEIYQFIDSQAHMTFDYLALTLIAAIIAGGGLLTDSSVVVVASMLVSPLMGPIMCITFGAKIGDRQMLVRGFRNEIVGVLITFLAGAAVALVVSPFEVDESWVTNEMTSRGKNSALIAGVAIAIPSGGGVALSCTNGGISALVGVAISASLLPPIVNAGICVTFGVIEKLKSNADDGFANEMLRVGGISFVLFLMNWALIYLASLLMFRLKNITLERKQFRKWRDNLYYTPELERRGSMRDMRSSVPPAKLDVELQQSGLDDPLLVDRALTDY